jgi:magnesium-transporting ATPase (P-type)
MPSAPISSLRVSEVYSALETSPQGLSQDEAASRLSLYGPNRLHVEKPVSLQYPRLLAQATHPMALLLWAAGLIAMIGGRPVLGLVIWLVVLVNAVFSFLQEYRAERAISSLEKLLPDFTRALRDGQETSLPSAEIVPGDILVLAEGDNIPADARVVQEYGLRVNNATLTGEAMPVRKTSEPSLRQDLTEVEQVNLVFAGTSVASGTSRAIVYATGSLTQFGRIARLTQETPERKSRLHEEMQHITRLFTILALIAGAMAFSLGFWYEHIYWLSAFMLAIGVVVAVIPEGLVPTLTLTLAIAVQRLATRGVLVKNLSMVETLGTTSVICTDKSGTLTQNQMTVREVWAGNRRYSVSGAGYEPKGDFSPAIDFPVARDDLRMLLNAAVLCNNSRLLPPAPERPRWSYLGDQTEAALRVLAEKGRVVEEEIQAEYPRIHELPFDARRKRMSTVHRLADSQEIVFVKGAPREVLQLCTGVRVRGENIPLDARMRSQILATNDEYARKALRVLALACRALPPRTGAGSDYSVESVERELTFLGLAAMMDPPRPEVADAIQRCREAGVQWVMITGDYGLTADSLARRIGMLSTANPRILTGAELEQLSDAQLQLILKQEVIFARMAPEHKLRLVAAFQANGDGVAVLGDGGHDAPARRKADIGIAMGVGGTDVARESADVILTNDNFGAVADAVEEGRTIFDNLRKFATYIFASNVVEVVPLLATAFFDLPLALTVTQILAIDLGTDLLPALALGTERPEPDVMSKPPRKKGQPLLDRSVGLRSLWLGLIEAGLCFSGFFFVYYREDPIHWRSLLSPIWNSYAELIKSSAGRTYVLATTMFHAGVVASQIGNVFSCRTSRERGSRVGFFSNRFLLISVAFEIGLIVSLIYLPPLASVFEHLPLPAGFWIWLAFYGPILYLIEKVRKGLIRRGVFARGGKLLPVAADRSEQE